MSLNKGVLMKFKFIFLVLSIFVFNQLFSGIDTTTKRTLTVFYGTTDNKSYSIRVYQGDDPGKFTVVRPNVSSVIYNIEYPANRDLMFYFCKQDGNKTSCGSSYSFILPKSSPKDSFVIIKNDGKSSNPI